MWRCNKQPLARACRKPFPSFSHILFPARRSSPPFFPLVLCYFDTSAPWLVPLNFFFVPCDIGLRRLVPYEAFLRLQNFGFHRMFHRHSTLFSQPSTRVHVTNNELTRYEYEVLSRVTISPFFSVIHMIMPGQVLLFWPLFSLVCFVSREAGSSRKNVPLNNITHPLFVLGNCWSIFCLRINSPSSFEVLPFPFNFNDAVTVST